MSPLPTSRWSAPVLVMLLLTLAAVGLRAQPHTQPHTQPQAQPPAEPQRVQIPSLDQGADGAPVMLLGHWSPLSAVSAGSTGSMASSGGRGAVVLLHGCGGPYEAGGRLSARMVGYTAWLHERGWSVLVLDSLTPRGERELCTQRIGNRRVTQANRRLDAWAALAWLAQQPGVDPRRLGLLGWSHGGSTVLAALQGERFSQRPATVPLPAFAVAYYPGCSDAWRGRYEPVAPLLIQMGEADDWTPPQPCRDWVGNVLQAGTRSAADLELVLYPEAYHGFDGEAPLRLRRDVPNGVRPGGGVHVGANPVAREAAFARMDRWLARFAAGG